MASDKVWEMKESSSQGQCSLKNPQSIGLLAVNRQLLVTGHSQRYAKTSVLYYYYFCYMKDAVFLMFFHMCLYTNI